MIKEPVEDAFTRLLISEQLSPFRRLSVRSDYDVPASFLVSFIHKLEEEHCLTYVEAAVIVFSD